MDGRSGSIFRPRSSGKVDQKDLQIQRFSNAWCSNYKQMSQWWCFYPVRDGVVTFSIVQFFDATKPTNAIR